MIKQIGTEHRRNLVVRTCKTCGCEFLTRADQLARGRGVYCTSKCANRYRIAANGLLGLKGESNPRWQGGISKDKYRYKLIQDKRYPDHASARKQVQQAIRSGKLKRGSCVVCGKENANAHHEDYSKPLDITWLCRTHHREAHGGKH